MKKTILTTIMFATVSTCIGWGDPGQGIHAGAWTLSPYTDISETYDSNANRSPDNKKSDDYTDPIVGLRAGYTSYNLDFNGLGFVSHRYYSKESDLDFDSAGDVLSLQYGTRDTIKFETDQSFRHVEDIDRYSNETAVGGISPDSILDVSSLARRDINQAGISAGKTLTDKLDIDAGYRFDDINYDNAALYDLRDHIGQIEFAPQLTDKTAGTLTLKGAVQKNLSKDNEAEYYAARLGLKTTGTDKISFKGSMGCQSYSLPGKDATTSFNFDVIAIWLATDKIWLQAGGRNGDQMSSLYSANGAEYTSFWMGGSYRVTPALTTTLSGAYRMDDYINPVEYHGALTDRKDKGFGGRLRADYQAPAQFLKIYGEATCEDLNSNVQGYNDIMLAFGVILSY